MGGQLYHASLVSWRKQMSKNQFTIIGPVNAGKTTYFAALYFLLKRKNNYEFRIDPRIDVKDRTYLTTISQAWALLEKIPRTPRSFWENLELPLRRNGRDDQITIYLPDMAGEFFNDSLKTRYLPVSLVEQLENSRGIMLFINPLDYRHNIHIDEKLVGVVQLDESIKPKPWDATQEILPSDVLYTDLIQQIFYHSPRREYRLAIIMSAWDKIKQSINDEDRALYDHPEGYLRKHFQLLTQFLDSHKGNFKLKVFGISAYGADPNSNTEKELMMELEPEERVKVIVSGQSNQNITHPLIHIIDNE